MRLTRIVEMPVRLQGDIANAVVGVPVPVNTTLTALVKAVERHWIR